MGQVASVLFFLLALVGAASIIALTIHEHWAEMLATLRGEMPVRNATRPWVRSVRAQVRPRPVQQRAAQPQRVAV